MPLVAPLPSDHDREVTDLSTFFNETLGFTPNSVLTMQRRPEIAKAFIGLNRAVMANHGRVTAEQKRLIAHVASLTAGCRYCEAHSILAAKRYGGADERLRQVWQFERNGHFTEAERAALGFAVAASTVPNAVTAEISARLHAHWTDDEIVEILGVISLFGFLNRWNDSMATSLEPPAIAAASTYLDDAGWDQGKHR